MPQLNKCCRLHGTVYISHALVYHHIMVGGQPKVHRQTTADNCLASVIQIVRCMSKCGGDAKRNLWEFWLRVSICSSYGDIALGCKPVLLQGACESPAYPGKERHMHIYSIYERSGVFASINTASVSLVQPSLCSPDQVLLLLDPEPVISHL